MKPAAILLILLLAGCASMEPAAPRISTVERPIPVPCIDRPPPRPTFSLERLHDQDLEATSDYELIIMLWMERAERIAYEAELEAALAACGSAPETVQNP